MGRMIMAAVVSAVLAAVLVTLLLHLFTGEANPAIVAGVTGAVSASAAISSRRKAEPEAPFGGVFEAEAAKPSTD